MVERLLALFDFLEAAESWSLLQGWAFCYVAGLLGPYLFLKKEDRKYLFPIAASVEEMHKERDDNENAVMYWILDVGILPAIYAAIFLPCFLVAAAAIVFAVFLPIHLLLSPTALSWPYVLISVPVMALVLFYYVKWAAQFAPHGIRRGYRRTERNYAVGDWRRIEEE
jgi:hypothetical protein